MARSPRHRRGRYVAETSFVIEYQGPALETGRMPVRELAPALLALGELFGEANRTVFPGSPPVHLEIRATADGSFVVELILVQPDLVDRMRDLFSGDSASALANLKDLVLLPAAGGLFWLIRTIRKRRIAREDHGAAGDTVRLVLEDGETIEVPDATLRLYRSIRIRKRVREVLEPLARPGIEGVAFQRDLTEEVSMEIGADDLDAFEPPDVVPVPLVDQGTEMAVAIAAVSFTEGNKWRLSDGDRTFFATIADDRFIERVLLGEESFRNGDLLRCNMRIQQTRTDDGVLHTDYTVTRVIEHIPAHRPVQMEIYDADASESD